MNILNTIMKLRYGLFCGVVGIGLLNSCNKDFASKLNFDEQPSTNKIQGTSYKIAYLVVEGGVGMIASQQASDIGTMPTLGDLSTHAMVSWNGVSAANGDDMTAYADLLTGVEYAKHKVNTTGGSNGLAKYPTLFKYIGDNTDSRMAFISSNSSLAGLVKSTDVDNYALQNTDVEVTAKAVEELKRDDAGLVVATFKNVDVVGKASGYGSNAYIAALGDFDKQLKSIVGTIEDRKSYSNEKWLIIVTSTKGGSYALPPDQNDGSIFAQPARNNFVLIYNPQFAFKSYERMQTVDPAWVSSAVKYSESSGAAALPVDRATLYNFGKGADAGDYTIQLKLKVHEMAGRNGKAGTPQNGVIFGKMKNSANFPLGWSMTYNGGSGWRFIGNASGGANYAADGGAFDLDTWYTLTVKIYKSGADRVVKLFRNGVLRSTVTNFAARDLSSNDPLQMGFQEGSYGTNSGFVHSIADVRIYKAAIPDDVIAAISCSTMPVPSSPFYTNLIGYWPANDGGMVLKDKSGNKRDFDMTGTYVWNSFSERSSSLCPTLPDNPEHYVIRSVDVPRMIYAWFNFSGIDRFDLDAQVWNPIFVNP